MVSCFCVYIYAPGSNDRGQIVVSCLSVCLLYTLTFAITVEANEILLHAFPTNKNIAVSNEIKVNHIETLTLTFMLKIPPSDFVSAGVIVFHMHFSNKNNIICLLQNGTLILL